MSSRAERLLARLGTPDLLCLRPPLWRALVAAGYTARDAIAAASGDEILAVPGLDAGTLWRLRHGLSGACGNCSLAVAYRVGRSQADHAAATRPPP